MRATLFIATLASAPVAAADEPSTAEVCQAAWDRTERVRVELGLRPGPKTMPDDPLRPRASCEALLTMPEDRLRTPIKEMTEVCSGDCRDLVPPAD
jgi:hypothetical protein